MGLVIQGNSSLTKLTAEIPTATYSGTSDPNDASVSINPNTGQGPGAGGAGLTTSQIEEARNPTVHFYQTLIDARTNAFYVATDGNDSNDGSLESPFLTLQKAVTTAASGDAVVVGAGTTTLDTSDNWGAGISVGGGFLDDYNNDIHFFGTPNSTILDTLGTAHGERDHHLAALKNSSSSVYGIIFTTDPGGSRTLNHMRAMFAGHSAEATTGNYFNCVFTSVGNASIVYDNSNVSSVQIVNSSFEVAGSWQANFTGDNLQFDITDCVFTGTPIFDEIQPTNTSSGVTLDDDWHSDTLDSTRGVYSGTNAWT